MNTATARWNPPKMSWWYDAIIDLMLERPDMNKTEIAEQFRVTPQCIYLITNSDVFKARFSQRRNAVAQVVDATINKRLNVVADQSLKIISEVLEKKRDSIPLPQLVDLADKTLERLGYGVKQPAAPSVQVNTSGPTQVVVPVTPADLERARGAIRAQQTHRALESLRRDSEEREGGTLSLGSQTAEESDPILLEAHA